MPHIYIASAFNADVRIDLLMPDKTTNANKPGESSIDPTNLTTKSRVEVAWAKILRRPGYRVILGHCKRWGQCFVTDARVR